MELANKAGDVKEMIDLRTNNLNFVVRHLEDALAMRHLRRRRRKNLSSTTSYYQKITSTGSTKDSPDFKDLTLSLLPVVISNNHSLTADTPWYFSIPLTVTHRSRVPGPRPCYPHSSSYLVGLYLIIKVLYIFNSTGQLFLSARFLGQPTVFYGAYMLFDLMHGDQWYNTGNFPRVTFCDFDMRRMGSNYHRHTLQCVIGINMFNEKIFIFLWFWLMIITFMNINSFLRWCCRSTFESSRVSFIQTLLLERNVISATTSSGTSCSSSSTYKVVNSNEDTSLGQQYPFNGGPLLVDSLTEVDKRNTTFFTEQVLGQDGVFVLRLVTLNAGRSVAAQIAEQVWNRYRQSIEPRPASIERRPPLSKLVLPPVPTRSSVIPIDGETEQQVTVETSEVGVSTPQPGPSTGTLQPSVSPLTTFGVAVRARARQTPENQQHRVTTSQSSSTPYSSNSTETSIKSEIRVIPYSDGLV
ncbi:Innexin [Fasciola gigantica]|uniref:Innexin n=1 Tax=Fasciola gigantica TaxID=46835 RepID=A0A504YUF8_FASGI|nr:Innexin [Fasciola gigantica]